LLLAGDEDACPAAVVGVGDDLAVDADATAGEVLACALLAHHGGEHPLEDGRGWCLIIGHIMSNAYDPLGLPR
jgi:hypothetical protein